MLRKILKKLHHIAKMGNDRGSILLISYLVITVLIGLGTVFVMYSVNEARIAERQRLSTVAFHIAEAGLERALYDLRQDFVADPSSPSWSDGDINGFAIGPDSDWYAMPYVSEVTLNGGAYTVDLKNDGDDVWVKSTGTISGVTHVIQVYVKMVDVSPWGYAIFAGAGAGGMMINGNVDIRGSVLILGNGLADGDLAMDLGGTAQLVGNNYTGMPASLVSKVPALPTKVVNGESVSTLNGKLRVKKGVVGLSGSATVGEPDVAGNAVKETVDGVYVVDGSLDNWGGNAGVSNVYSDNGTNNGFDLGDAVRFPSLSDPAAENPAVTFQQYFQSQALNLTTELSNVKPDSSFAYGNCSTDANCITSDGSGNLYIKGRIYVAGDVNFNKKNPATTISYTGNGSILATGSVGFTANLVTPGNNSFPNNIMGIMTPGTITMNDSNMDVMGLFYAETSIVSSFQTDVVGSFVANYFDMGSNVPAIYQVPEAANNLPPGMIGNTARWFMVVVWQKV